MPRIDGPSAALAALLLLSPAALRAQALDMSHGGPVTVTALGGIDWDQQAQTVTAHDDARAVRGGVTVTADRLIAHYRKKAGAPGAPPASGGPKPPQTLPLAAVAQPNSGQPPGGQPPGGQAQAGQGQIGQPGAPDDTGSNEIYRLEADGHVHIYTATDQAWGDHGVYDMDQAVLVLTGKGLKLTTPTDLMTARDAMEYWSQKHMSVGRGDASVTSNDGRSIRGDTLVGYSVDPNAPPAPGAPKPPPLKKDDKAGQDPLLSSGKLQKVEAFGHVQVRTATEIVTGERGVYVPDTGLARIVGHVHITRGDNQLNGAAAIVNMKTGVATLTETPGARVQGLIVPNEQQPKAGGGAGAGHAGDKPAPGRKTDETSDKDDN